MKIQPLKDQLIGKRFWSRDNTLYTIAYKEDEIFYVITYYRKIWTRHKYQRSSSLENIFHKGLYSKQNILNYIEKGYWRKYEDTSK